jgi:hypothetical protein
MKLVIVSTCAARKDASGQAPVSLRDYPHEESLSAQRRADKWIAALEASPAKPVAAMALYKGDHWQQTMEAVDAARAQGHDVELWVLSTGYGLIPADRELLKPYNATFTATMSSQEAKSYEEVEAASDAIVPRRWNGTATDRRAYCHAWWNALAAWQPEGAAFPRRLSDLTQTLPSDARMLVIASEAYLEVVLDDLKSLAAEWKDADRLMVVSAGASSRIRQALGDHHLPVDARFTQVVGGAKTSLNARTAAWLVRNLSTSEFGRRAARAALLEAQANLVKAAGPTRTKLTDEALTDFIRQSAAPGHIPSAGQLLKRLRETGQACEAKRFATLWRQVTVGIQAPPPPPDRLAEQLGLWDAHK